VKWRSAERINFKAINDSFSPQLGDDLLVTVGERLQRALRPSDTVARISGDEFVVLCEELDRDEQVEVVASRVVDALGTPFLMSGTHVQISASVGFASRVYSLFFRLDPPIDR
jgi:diguanylate cyclase (GGDEF)-like protein